MHVPSICEAIRAKSVVAFTYDGGFREVEPHSYGLSRKGHELLRAYQVSGFSRSGDSQGWKLFRVDEIASLSVTAERFNSARPGFDRIDDAMVEVFCSV